MHVHGYICSCRGLFYLSSPAVLAASLLDFLHPSVMHIFMLYHSWRTLQCYVHRQIVYLPLLVLVRAFLVWHRIYDVPVGKIKDNGRWQLYRRMAREYEVGHFSNCVFSGVGEHSLYAEKMTKMMMNVMDL